MNWSTEYKARDEQPAPPPVLDQAVANLKKQIQIGGFIMLTKEQAAAVIAKLEQPQ